MREPHHVLNPSCNMQTETNMKIAIISTQPITFIPGLQQFRDELSQESAHEIVCLQYAPGEPRDLIGEIRAFHPELLITIDLAGFEQCTLTDNISYNLLDCKQLHLLLHENLPNEPYLSGQLSIAMFFYCAGDSYCDKLMAKYPHLPWLGRFPGGKPGEFPFNEVFLEVLRECGLQK